MAIPSEFRCPECNGKSVLGTPRGPLHARVCPRCEGALLERTDAEKTLGSATSKLDMPARLLPALRCPACEAQVPRTVLGTVSFSLCEACGAAWIGPGPLPPWLEARVRGTPPAAPEPGGPAAGGSAAGGRAAPRSAAQGGGRPSRRLALLGAVAVGALALAGGVAWLLPRLGRQAGGAAVAADALPQPAPPVVPAVTTPAARAAAAPSKDLGTTPVLLTRLERFDGGVEELPRARGGPRVLLASRPGEAASVLVRFAAGAVDDVLPGQTRVAQHALLSANRRLDHPRFVLDVRAAGAELDLRTGPREAEFQLTADRRDFLPLARRLLEALLAPDFDETWLGRATDRAALDSPEDPSTGALVAMIAAEDYRFTNPPIARRHEIKAIKPSLVAGYLQGPLSPANATVVIAGAFDRDELVRLLQRFHGGAPTPIERVKYAVPFAARRQGDAELYLLAQPITIEGARDAAAARLASALLDDALWRRFRRSGDVYAPSGRTFVSAWSDLLVLALPAREDATRLEPGLREALADLGAGRFSEADLQRARSAVRGALEEIDGDPARLALALADGGPNWHGKEVGRQVDLLDRPTLTELVRPWIDPARSIYFYLGTQP